MAREFHDQNSVAYDAVADLAIHLASLKSMELIDGSMESLDSRWPRERLEEFLTQLRDFARQSEFSEFYAAQAPLYQEQCEFWQNMLEESQVVPWVERFYGDTRPLHFAVVTTALKPGGVGKSREEDGEFYCYMVTSSGDINMTGATPEEKVRAITSYSRFLAHEFSHPWTNPVTTAIYPQIQATAEKIFPTFQDTLNQQAYGRADIMMIETFNRAAELVYLHDRYGEDKTKNYIARYKAQGFLLIDRLYRCILAEREAGGASWRFSDSAQAYINCINAEESMQLLDEYLLAVANAPSIVSLSPANGARNVDPATTELVATFSKPMKRGMAICNVEMGSASKLLSAAYNDAGTALTIKAQLEPNQKYRMWFNSGAEYRDFASTDGGILPATEYVFYTGPAQ